MRAGCVIHLELVQLVVMVLLRGGDSIYCPMNPCLACDGAATDILQIFACRDWMDEHGNGQITTVHQARCSFHDFTNPELEERFNTVACPGGELNDVEEWCRIQYITNEVCLQNGQGTRRRKRLIAGESSNPEPGMPHANHRGLLRAAQRASAAARHSSSKMDIAKRFLEPLKITSSSSSRSTRPLRRKRKSKQSKIAVVRCRPASHTKFCVMIRQNDSLMP